VAGGNSIYFYLITYNSKTDSGYLSHLNFLLHKIRIALLDCEVKQMNKIGQDAIFLT